LELQWDHIMYTGSGRVGRVISAAAAKHLTPVTLELGGKCPVVIDPACDMALAARRVLWGKNFNAGQICVAPDYVLIPREAQDVFVDALKKEYATFYPQGGHASNSFARIITPDQFARIKKLLDTTHGTVVLGGEMIEAEKYIAPTVVTNCTGQDSLLTEEIFGPILPIVPVKDVDEAIAFINSRDHPLTLYVFSRDKKFKAKVMDNTQSGSAIMNECVLHTAADGVPFGGIGPSGSGMVSGKFAFDTFTHHRTTLDSPGYVDAIGLSGRYPPYTDKKEKSLSGVVIPSLPPRDGKGGHGFGKWTAAVLVAGGIGYAASKM